MTDVELAELRWRREIARNAVHALEQTDEIGPAQKTLLLEGPRARLRAAEASVRAGELMAAGAPVEEIRVALDEAAAAERDCDAIVALWLAGPVAGGPH